MGLLESLAVLFIALKLCGVITWSWVWVLSPLIVVAAIILFASLTMLVAYFSTRPRRKKIR